jgi:hypothetical protein
MKTYYRSVHLLLCLIGVSALLVLASNAQTTQPTDATAPPPATRGPTAAITFQDGSSLKIRGSQKSLPLVAAQARQTLNVQSRFPSSLGGTAIMAQPLDGGAIVGKPSIAADGTVSIQFQTASQPGLYRVLVRAGNAETTLQFWVGDPQNPSSNPAALKP